MLTLTQPWASLVALGAKRIETRSWFTNYRGRIAIHAAKTLNGLVRGPVAEQEAAFWQLCKTRPFAEALAPLLRPATAIETQGTLLDGLTAYTLSMPRGAIVAVAELVACLPTATTQFAPPWASTWEPHFGDYSPGRYAWVLQDVRPLAEPYEIRGERGLQTLDPRVAEDIMEAVA